jgi:hypothetical protein
VPRSVPTNTEVITLGVDTHKDVHVAKPGMKVTYCGRPINEEDWVTTSREANCTGCARAGAPTMLERPGRGS